MYSVGKILEKKSATGHRMVNMYMGKDQITQYCLGNEEIIPDNVSEYGLFSFSPDDQFCYWLDPNVKLEDLENSIDIL